MRKSSLFLIFTLAGWLFLGMLCLDARLRTRADLPRRLEERQVAETLSLTDLCLATESRHTRNPSQADWHSPFQNHPAALDPFPSGSVIPPPAAAVK